MTENVPSRFVCCILPLHASLVEKLAGNSMAGRSKCVLKERVDCPHTYTKAHMYSPSANERFFMAEQPLASCLALDSDG